MLLRGLASGFFIALAEWAFGMPRADRVDCLYHVAGTHSSSQTTTGLALPRTAARCAWKLVQVEGLPAAIKQSSLMAVVALCCFAISRSLLATLTVSPVAVMCWWAEGPSLEITTGP